MLYLHIAGESTMSRRLQCRFLSGAAVRGGKNAASYDGCKAKSKGKAKVGQNKRRRKKSAKRDADGKENAAKTEHGMTPKRAENIRRQK